MKFPQNSLCPCNSKKKYKKCCKPYHDNITSPQNALELMKSRFSAYCVANVNYIISTTHEKNPEYTKDILSWRNDIKKFSENTKFDNLDIIDFQELELESFVTFKATLFQGNKDISFIEKSRFLKENNKWFYIDGEFIN